VVIEDTLDGEAQGYNNKVLHSIEVVTIIFIEVTFYEELYVKHTSILMIETQKFHPVTYSSV